MNRSIIKKILKQKYERWLDSIELPEVRKLAEQNGIITGGSIVSLLLGEPVKDYDIYFKNKETVLAVANYYVDRFNGINPNLQIPPKIYEDGERVKIKVQSSGISSVNGDSGYKYFEQFPDEVGNDWLEKVTSIADETNSECLDEIKPEFNPVFMSSNAITLSGKIQIVIRFYGEPEEIHKNYDYIHCCNYWESSNNQLSLNKDALESILTKTLYYQGSLYPLCSVIRMRKFLKRGWYINAGQILKMLMQISELDLTNVKVLEDQLTGVDAAYFHQVIDYCQERMKTDQEFKVTTPYLISVIDKIFG